jgi:16S rRNA processing protein RimM
MINNRILMAELGAAHGIKGEVRLKFYGDDPAGLTDYGPLQDENGKAYKILSFRPSKEIFITRIDGITSRELAEKLARTKLYLDRNLLPETENDEFYHSDLIGLEAHDEQGKVIGKVQAVYDFGAGDLLDIMPDNGKSFLVPFTQDVVPEVNIKQGFCTVIRPPETQAREGENLPDEDGDA